MVSTIIDGRYLTRKKICIHLRSTEGMAIILCILFISSPISVYMFITKFISCSSFQGSVVVFEEMFDMIEHK